MRFIGRGGFGDVYQGQHVTNNALAAIKLMETKLDADDLKLFIQETSTIFRMKHPRIVQMLDFGISSDGIPFLAMAYAPNGTLRQRHPRGTRLPLATVVSYITPIADALQFVHNQKRVHCDVKPENILLGPYNELWLSDFGISIISRTSSMHSPSSITGTAYYMAPEQFRGQPEPASDQYALAVMIYEWLSGAPPFTQGDFIQLGYQHTHEPVLPLRSKVADIPIDVEQVIMAALAKEPGQRFVSISAFALALQQTFSMGISPLILRMPPTPIPSQVSFAINAVSPSVKPVSPSLNTPYFPVQTGIPKIPVSPLIQPSLDNSLKASSIPKNKRRAISLDLLIGLPLTIIAILLEFFPDTRIPENIILLTLFELYLLPKLFLATHLELHRCIDIIGYRLRGKSGLKIWYYFNAPGIILHQLSRAIVMVLLYPFGFRLTSITFFRIQEGVIQEGTKQTLILGTVNYKRPPRRLTTYIGDGLSSIAPLIVGVALFLFLYWLSTGYNIWGYSWQNTLHLQIIHPGWPWWLFILSSFLSLTIISQLWLKRQEWKGPSFLAISLVLIMVVTIVLANNAFTINGDLLLGIMLTTAHLDFALLALLVVDTFFLLVAEGMTRLLLVKHP